VKSNITISVDTKLLENFNRIKGKEKISHLVEAWLEDYIIKEKANAKK